VRFSHALSLVVCMCLCTTTSIGAQLIDLVPGARVRMQSALRREEVDGTIIARDADSLVIATPVGVQHRVALQSLARLDLYRGRSRMVGAKKGAFWGAAVIAVPLALILATSNPKRDHWSRSDELHLSVALVRLYAVNGAVIGAFVKADSWQRCPRLTAPTCGNRP